ncbi:MAG: thiamine phosphate synthase [Acetobacteraceae bacterium]|nr:thiamine phosphate synthase [Acetobacteraceae bacterium]
MPELSRELPRLYAIVDVGCFSVSRQTTSAVVNFACELAAGGVELIQYRNKDGDVRTMLSHARELRRVLGRKVTLIMNDRADLSLAADFDGVHVGQDDLSPEGARLVVGTQRMVGVSTHTLGQVRQADASPVDYIAYGPIFSTTAKRNPDPVVGLDGLRAARAETKKPLVAIGGITRANVASVREAGADCVAVISDLVSSPRQAAEEVLRRMV